MSRFLLALLMLAATVSAQAITPSRQDADGTGGGNCPDAEEIARAEDAAAPAAAPPAPAKTTAPPAQAKEAAPLAPRPRAGARWHSFLPGMFK